MLTSKIGVLNSTKRPRIVWVEPWGEDYTLLPGEQLEIVCQDESEQPWFSVVENEDSSQVYIERGGDFQVVQDGKRLDCGHNRKYALESGLKL